MLKILMRTSTIFNIKTLEHIICFCCFFPFISFINIGTDMQPYALLFSTFYLLFDKKYNLILFKKYFFFIFVSVLFVVISLLNTQNSFSIIRSFANGISMPIISIAVCKILIKGNVVEEKHIKTYIIVWMIIGIIQILGNVYFLSSVVPNMRTTIGRGVCSLSTEPSYYGYMCFFFLIISNKFHTHRLLFTFLILFQIFFIAQSSVTIVYVVLLITFSLVESSFINRNIKTLLLIIASVSVIPVIIYLLNKYLPSSRIVNLISTFISGESMLLDKSIEIRFDSIRLSIIGFLDFYGLPHTYFSFNEQGFGRISSGYGGLLFEYGIIGVYYIFLNMVWIKKAFNTATAIVITIVMFSAIQLGNAMFAFILGYSMYIYYKNLNEKNTNSISYKVLWRR